MIGRVALVGGTHGNELTGITVVRRAAAGHGPLAAGPSGAELEVMIGNPKAVQLGRRYVDRDLNRCFSHADLTADLPDYEQQRARLIDARLGPKACEQRRVDLAIDLHTTPSRLGTTVIVREDDRTALQIAALAVERIPELRVITYLVDHAERGVVGGPGATAEPGDYPFLVESAAHGIEVEIGPIAQGVIRAETLALTERVVAVIFRAVDTLNAAPRTAPVARTLHVWRFVADVDYPRDSSGAPAGYIHPDLQDHDFQPLQRGTPVFLKLDGTTTVYDREPGLVPLFVNEAAYYEKGVAFALARRHAIELATPAWATS